MRGEGLNPSVLMTSYNWRLFEDLGLDSESALDPPLPVPEGIPQFYRGRFDGLLVLDWPKRLRGEVLVIDVHEFATWHQYGDEALQVDVSFADGEEVVPSSGLEETSDRTRAVARISTSWSLEVRRPPAARRLRLPEEGSNDLAA
jgi:hypothetical protein